MNVDGQRLRRLREERALSLRELGALADVTQDNIWKIENGKTLRPHPKTIRKLAKALGVEPKGSTANGARDGKSHGVS